MKYLFMLFIFNYAVAESKIEHCDRLIKEGIDALYNKEHTKSLELLIEAKTLAESNHWYDQIFLSTNAIGLNYYQMLDYAEALDYYLNAYTLAIKKLTPEREMTVLNNIALVYLQEGKFKDSESYQKRAYDIATTVKDTVKKAMYAGNLAALYVETKQFKKASFYIEIAKSFKINDTGVLMQLYNTEAENLIAKKEYDKAKQKIDFMLDKLNLIKYNEYKIAVYLMLSKIYVSQNKMQEALSIAQEAKKENITYNNNIAIYSRLSDLYFLKQEYKKALSYKDSVIIVKDSLNVLKDRTLYQSSKIKIEIQNYQKQLNISQNKLEAEKKIRYYLIGSGFLIVSLLLWLLRSNYIKYKQKRIITERTQKIITLELKNKENDNLLLENKIKEKETVRLLEKEKWRNQLEAKNRKLAANALSLANRNEKIIEFLSALDKKPELIADSYLAKQIVQLKDFITKQDEINDFLIHFEEINSQFIYSIKKQHPSLNANDIRFICYLYMNFTIKEISSLFNITIEAARKRKERISRKMNLKDSGLLYDYLLSI